MKIRNKTTGEIATLTLDLDGETLIIMKDDEMIVYGVSLEDLIQDWEDYKYPNYYFIDYDGVIIYAGENEKFKNEMKEIGNYFETREEAEKAVEKFKAWKRLKDKGFRFNGVYEDYTIQFTAPKEEIGWYWRNGMGEDLDLLFGVKDE
jgi:superfamily II DNA or RNA helicase